MKNILIILTLSCLNIFAAQEGFKISGYPNKPRLATTDLFITAAPGVTNNNIAYSQLEAQLETNIINSSTFTNRVLPLITNAFNEVHPRDFGAQGDGAHDDTPAFKSMAAYIQALGAATVKMEQGVTYNVSSVVNQYPLMSFTNLSGFKLEGNGSSFYIGDAVPYGSFIVFNGCTNIEAGNLVLRSDHTNEVSNSKGPEWFVFDYGSQNIWLHEITWIGGAMAYTCRGPAYNFHGTDANRTRVGLVENCQVFSTYYGNNLQGAGDYWTVKNWVSRNTGRSLFIVNAHDIDFDINGQMGGPGFSDVLISVTAATNWNSSVYNIKGKYTSDGMFPGSTDEVAENALIQLNALMFQNGNNASAKFDNIDIEFAVTNTPVSKLQGIFGINKNKAGGTTDNLPRGHVFSSIRIHGVASGMTNCILFPIQLFARGSDDWTGDYINNITVGPMELKDAYNKLSIFANGAGFITNGTALTVDSVNTDGYLAVIANPSQYGVVVKNSSFTNLITDLDHITYINGSTSTGVVVRVQTQNGGTYLGGRTFNNGALNINGLVQVINGSAITLNSGDTNNGPALVLINTGTNLSVKSSSYTGSSILPLSFDMNGVQGIGIATNGAVTIPNTLTVIGNTLQVAGGTIIATSSATPNTGPAILIQNNGVNAIVQANKFSGIDTPLNLWTSPTTSSGGITIGTNGNVTMPASLIVLGSVNSATGYMFQNNAVSGTYLRGNGTVYIPSLILAGDIPTGIGITNNGGVVSNNIAGGAGITLTTGANGRITISGSSTNGGTITNVAVTVPAAFSTSGSPLSGGGGTIAISYSGSAIPIANGGTAGTTAAAARTALGLNTGLGITNNGSLYSNNITAGAGISITNTTGGALIISASGGGTNPPSGNGVVLVNGGVFVDPASPIQDDFNGNAGSGGFLRNIFPVLYQASYYTQNGGGRTTGDGTYVGYDMAFSSDFVFEQEDINGGYRFTTAAFGGGGNVIFHKDGDADFVHIGGNLSGTPGVVKNVGLGAGPSAVALDGDANDSAMTITYTIGTGPTASSVFFTVTFAVPYLVAPHITWSPANDRSLINPTKIGFPTGITTTGFTFTCSSIVPTPGDIYALTFHVIK